MGIAGKIASFGVQTAISKAVDTGTSYLANKAISGELKMPSAATNALNKLGVGFEGGELKLPYGLNSYIAKPVADMLSSVGAKIPTSINGVPLPALPDISQAAGPITSALSSVGLDTDILGMRSISDILDYPDLTAVINGKLPTSATVATPDINSIMKDFNPEQITTDIDIDSYVKDAESHMSEFQQIANQSSMDIDISKFF